MKKHNEGYALVLVLVVITVLCLVAMAMTAASLRNLKNQQDSIDRMEAKYAAQGEIEKVIGEFEQKLRSATSENALTVFSVDNQNADLAGTHVKCTSITYSWMGQVEDANKDHDFVLISLETTDLSKPIVNCAIKITGNITADDGTNAYTVDIKGLDWQYASYAITEKEAVLGATE